MTHFKQFQFHFGHKLLRKHLCSVEVMLDFIKIFWLQYRCSFFLLHPNSVSGKSKFPKSLFTCTLGCGVHKEKLKLEIFLRMERLPLLIQTKKKSRLLLLTFLFGVWKRLETVPLSKKA